MKANKLLKSIVLILMANYEPLTTSMNLNKQGDAVIRTVKQHTLDSGADGRTVSLTQVLDADITTVLAHITEHDIIKTWFTPVSGDLRQGGQH